MNDAFSVALRHGIQSELHNRFFNLYEYFRQDPGVQSFRSLFVISAHARFLRFERAQCVERRRWLEDSGDRHPGVIL